MTLHQVIPPRAVKRRTFTVKDVERMVKHGLILPDERVELIAGELVQMPAKGIQHEVLKGALMMRWARVIPDTFAFLPETTLRLSADTYLEPDFVVFPRQSGLRGLSGKTAVLAVEIADSSISYDLKHKPLVFAWFGIPELWVVNAVKRTVHVHRDPAETGYRDIKVYGDADLITPLKAPAELALRLADLDGLE